MKKEIFIQHFNYLPARLKNITKTLFLIVLLLFSIAGCHSDTEEVVPLFKDYQFDQKVIDKLPVYDSLAAAIVESFPVFKKNMDANKSYQAFRYIPGSDKAEVFKKLPPETGVAIGNYYTKLGSNFIYGFDVFKDSSIKIYIRTTPSKSKVIDIEENLSYYPAGKKFRQREFPVKDSILNEHWQYWTRFNKQDLF